MVNTARFECAAAVLVLINAVFIGAETNAACTHHHGLPPRVGFVFELGELLFMFLFLTEWCMRICAHGLRWFIDDPHVCWFDTAMIAIQVSEQVIIYMYNSQQHVPVFSVVRILRLLRIIRLLRLLHLFTDLRLMVDAIYAAASDLFWAGVLVTTGLSASSVLFARLALDHEDNSGKLDYFFGSVPRTALTLLEAMIGGISWDEPCMVLFQDVGAVAGMLFISSVTVGLFVLLNVLTGVFIDQAMKTADQEKADQAVSMINRALKNEIEKGMQIDIDTFRQKLDEPGMLSYLEDLNMSPEDADELFRIIDADHSGVISASELVTGLGKLRKPARIIDVSHLLRDTSRLDGYLRSQLKNIDMIVESVAKRLSVPVQSKSPVKQFAL